MRPVLTLRSHLGWLPQRQLPFQYRPRPRERRLGDGGPAGHALQRQNAKVENPIVASTARTYGVRKFRLRRRAGGLGPLNQPPEATTSHAGRSAACPPSRRACWRSCDGCGRFGRPMPSTPPARSNCASAWRSPARRSLDFPDQRLGDFQRGGGSPGWPRIAALNAASTRAVDAPPGRASRRSRR